MGPRAGHAGVEAAQCQESVVVLEGSSRARRCKPSALRALRWSGNCGNLSCAPAQVLGHFQNWLPGRLRTVKGRGDQQ